MAETTTLVAGRELDALVAEKVCGRYPVQWESGEPYAPLDAENHEPSRFDAWVEVPRFSHDIAAAMEALTQLGGRATIVREIDHWSVWIGDTARGWWAETLPLAICRAALAAVTYPTLSPTPPMRCGEGS
jgi:hypothetical protein